MNQYVLSRRLKHSTEHTLLGQAATRLCKAEDVSYRYRCFVVCVYVCVSVGHNRENSRTDRGVVWANNSGGISEPYFGGGPAPMGRGSLGDTSQPIVKYREYLACDSILNLIW